jgi:iron complex outermembrane receptor protein
MWGAEWKRIEHDSPFWYHERRSHARDEHRLFANLELRTGTDLLWNAGGMLEQLQGDEARLAPRVFLNWQAAPQLTWRIGHSRAWRQPDLFERNVDIRITDDKGELVQRRQYPNPDLRPQRIDASEIGMLGVFGDSRSTLDVRLFRERIDGPDRAQVPFPRNGRSKASSRRRSREAWAARAGRTTRAACS